MLFIDDHNGHGNTTAASNTSPNTTDTCCAHGIYGCVDLHPVYRIKVISEMGSCIVKLGNSREFLQCTLLHNRCINHSTGDIYHVCSTGVLYSLN